MLDDSPTRRGPLELHLRALGFLLAAGPEGMPLAMLGRTLYPYARPKRARQNAASLIDAMGLALPIWDANVDGVTVVGLDARHLSAWMRARYGLAVAVVVPEDEAAA